MDDPFAPEFDPYVVAEARVGRRRVLLAIGAAAALVSAGGCVQRRVACLPVSATSAGPACSHRFCRYYRGP